jgi:putative colanic acid biosynthesis UDP-glucose lipid carrier transferase
MNTEFRKSLKTILVFLDLTAINFVWLITYLYFLNNLTTQTNNLFYSFAFFVNFIWITISLAFGLYDEKSVMAFEVFSQKTAKVYFLWLVLMALILVYAAEIHTISEHIIFFSFFSLLGISANRLFYLGIKKYLSQQHDMINRVLILGFNDTAKKLAKYLEEDGLNTQLMGFVENDENMDELTTYPVYANIENAVNVAKQLNVHEIFSTITPEQNNIIYRLIRDSEEQCMRFKVVPSLSSHVNKDVVIDFIKDLPVLSMRADPLEDVGNRMKKRIFDVVVSGLVIIFILTWLIPLVAILILLDSRGPVFFTQLRTGLTDNPFFCYKFRTMRVNNESDSKQATKHDSRVTRLGAFLRKTSIDEFPQFFNVFRGEMSLVGPRPHMLKHTSEYAKIVEHYMIRQMLKPGITGWAQVNGLRGEISSPMQIQQRVASDLWYLEHWSIWLDIKIMFLTIHKVFVGDKLAY